MANDIDPVVHNWYQYLGQRFHAVTVNDGEGFVEIHYPDSRLEEVEPDACLWRLKKIRSQLFFLAIDFVTAKNEEPCGLGTLGSVNISIIFVQSNL